MADRIRKQKKAAPFKTQLKRLTALLLGSATLTVSLLGGPALAGDPFRPSAPNASVDDQTETAFQLIFRDGDYASAIRELDAAEQAGSEDPLIYAMQASMAFLDQDWAQLTEYAVQTEVKAQELMAEDELRGHLYQAVGIFMRGAAVLKEQGIARGTPQALGMLQQVFSHIGEAEKIDPNDPELSLLKGFMDLMLAVNLPFSNPGQAIDRLENTAYPDYVAQRGIALGYRDLSEYNNALDAVNAALDSAGPNPELLALKAQILAKDGNQSESLTFYQQALESESQLHPRLASQIRFEHCVVEGQTPGPTCFADSGLDAYQP